MDSGLSICITADQNAVVLEDKAGKRNFVKIEELRDISEGIGFIFTKKTINDYAKKENYPLLTDEELDEVFDANEFKKVSEMALNILIDDVLRNFYDEKNKCLKKE
jgi:hypothetical protein